MGRMIDGVWVTETQIAADPDGAWRRAPSVLRDWVTRDGTRASDGLPGAIASDVYPAEAGRYHLYGAINCPWAHRTALVRVVMGLEDVIGLSTCAPRLTDQGWVFDAVSGFTDHLCGSAALHELYHRSDPGYSGRATTPVLWDRHREKIVSNESADIVRMLATQFGTFASQDAPDLYPCDLRDEIDALSSEIHDRLNNGVYRAGFAGTQEAYEGATRDVFAMLDALEARLGSVAGRAGHATDTPGPFLHGSSLTETDLRLFPTLARFDVAYHSAFKCNLRRLTDYPHLWGYAKRLYRHDGVAATADFDIYRRGYHSPSAKRNPLGIVPIGPQLDWATP